MKEQFKDHFSNNSKGYGKFRPKYPAELFCYLSSISSEHERAWDCATGTGQAALSLSKYFSNVIATDASEAQINHAEKKPGVSYRVATAEQSHIENNSIDLITVAQAFHWFNVEAFSKEAARVLKGEGLVSVWTYNLLVIQEDIDELISYLYHRILGDYWPKEREMVEDGYKYIQLPFKEIESPEFNMSAEWDLHQLLGFFNTWSATRKYQKQTGVNPVDKIANDISKIWGTPEKVFPIKWPLSMRVWRKNA